MKKRFFIFTLILFLLTLSACNLNEFFTTTEWKTGTKATSLTTDKNNNGSNSGNQTTTTHTHEVVYQVVKEAKCEEDGEAKRYCSICGKVIEEHIVIPALGHDWDEIRGTEPTCTEPGFTTHSTCERCGKTVNAQILPALGHSFKYKTAYTPLEDNTESHAKTTYSCEHCHKDCYADLTTNYKAAYGYQFLSNITGKGIIYASLYKWYYDTALDFLNNEREISTWEYDLVDGTTHQKVGTETAYEISRKRIDDLGLTIEEAAGVYHTFLFDCPEFFFLKSGYVQLTSGSQKFFVLECDGAFQEYSYRQICQTSIHNMCIDLADDICNEEDELKRIKIIHDFIIDRVNYGFQEDGVTPLDNAEAHCIIGISAGSDGSDTAVCEAYTKAFLYLSRLYGINSIAVHGQGHAWNMVEYNGEWYGLDVTWDDPTNYHSTIYQYFMKNEADFNDTDSQGMHVPYEADFALSLGYQFTIPEFAETSYNVNPVTGKITK